MRRPTSFRTVIELWGTREALAEDFGIDSRAASKWWQRDCIPPIWWFRVSTSAVGRKNGVTVELLERLARAKENAA